MSGKKPLKVVVAKFKLTHGDFYDYSKVDYINCSTRIKIICPKHGEFWQIPSNHAKGSCCPKCTKVKQREGTFKKKCKDAGVDYYRALKRRQAGLSEDKIFAKGTIRHEREINEITVFEKIYPNLKEAIRALKPTANRKTITRWINEGKSPEEAFGRIPNPGYAEGIIYLITNIVTGKKYIGLTIQTLSRRWAHHLEQSQSNQIKSTQSLHAAIREYGGCNFTAVEIDKGITKNDLESKERKWIKELITLIPFGYNISTGGVSGGSNKKPTFIDGRRFESTKKAAEYVSDSRNISIHAAKRRILNGRIDIKTPAKPGESLVYTKTYKIWSRLKYGVLNPNSKEYIPGVSVYEVWLNDFNKFYEDVELPPADNMAFARLDKDNGFYPDNCKWMTKSEASKINAIHMKKNGKLRGKSSFLKFN